MSKKSPLLLCASLLLAACNQIPLDSPTGASKSPTPAPPAAAPLALTPSPDAIAAVAQESKPQKDARMQWWREARFGMFIHWGLYSVPAGIYDGKPVPNLGEWIMNFGSIPVDTYANYAKSFNPTKFNADEFVATAKNAGMKYIVITAKHHDGFAMFKSADPFNIVDATPFHRDIIKELETAAHKAGLRFGVYYSQSQDWHHPGGFSIDRNGRKDGDGWDPAPKGSFDDYLQKIALPQTRELLTNYKLDVLWWDTPGPITRAQATPLHDLLALQPHIISNNRLMNTRLPGAYIGDTETPEQTIPANGYPGGRDWETCMTINTTWGYKSTDTNFKTTQTLLLNLIDCASKGGNYLLNVGPTAEGLIPQPEVDRLLQIGKWLDINGEAIYGTGPNPFPAPAAPTATTPATPRPARAPVVWDWRATSKPGKIYIHIMQWPADGMFQLPASASINVKKAYLLADPNRTPLEMLGDVNGARVLTRSIKLPAKSPDQIATVICLELANN